MGQYSDAMTSYEHVMSEKPSVKAGQLIRMCTCHCACIAYKIVSMQWNILIEWSIYLCANAIGCWSTMALYNPTALLHWVYSHTHTHMNIYIDVCVHIPITHLQQHLYIHTCLCIATDLRLQPHFNFVLLKYKALWIYIFYGCY